MRNIMAITGFMCAAFLGECASGAEQTVSGIDKRASLVEAVVTDIAVERKTTTGTLTIQKVLAGDLDLRGRTFTCPSHDTPQQGSFVTIDPVPKFTIDEKGVWIVYERNGELHPSAWKLFPARDGISDRYDDAVALSRAIEEVQAADGDAERLARLRTFAYHEVPFVARWSVERIEAAAKSKNAEAAEALRELAADSKVAFCAQIGLDQILCRLDDDWGYSDERFELLKRVASAPLGELEAMHFSTRLGHIVQGNARRERFGMLLDALPNSRLFELSRLTIRNDRIPIAHRPQGLAVLSIVARTPAIEPEAWEFAVEVLRGEFDPKLRLTVAKMLDKFELDDARRTTLHEIKEATDDDAIRTALDRALQQSDGKKSP
jgi:hypothetical protein